MTIEVRLTQPHEYRAAAEAFTAALLVAPPDDERWERSLPSWQESTSVSAWDGARCVGHAGQFYVNTVVPGGAQLPTGAVSRVGVVSTHRRRGAASSLMRALVDDARSHGLPLMSLRASESTIYGRFGFGVAGDSCAAELDVRAARPLRTPRATGSFRVLDADDIVYTIVPLYGQVAMRRPGAISRPASWWRRLFEPAIKRTAAAFVVVHTDDDGNDDGYVQYSVEWESGVASQAEVGRGDVHDLFGATDRAELALWHFLLDIDLVRTWRLHQRPVDDLVVQALADRRAYRQLGRFDEQWLRIVDVDVALGARTYGPARGAVVIQVADPWIGSNHGTWRVSAEGVERAHTDPDLVTDIAGLSAAYLGGTTWSGMVGAGVVHCERPESIAIADALFGVGRAPHCGTFF